MNAIYSAPNHLHESATKSPYYGVCPGLPGNRASQVRFGALAVRAPGRARPSALYHIIPLCQVSALPLQKTGSTAHMVASRLPDSGTQFEAKAIS